MVDAIWVEGRVVLPDGVPADEKYEVVASATALPRFREFAATPDARGRFRVAFAKDARRGKLSIRGRYLYLDPEVSWRADADAAEVVLTPKLGGYLHGRLSMPESTPQPYIDNSNFSWTIQLEGIPRSAGNATIQLDLPFEACVDRDDLARASAPQSPTKSHVVHYPDVEFDRGGLPIEYDWSLTAIHNHFVPMVVERLSFEAGKRQDHTWAVKNGAIVSGTIVDETGAPVADALIDVDCRGAPLAPPPWDVQHGIKTIDDGRFFIRGLAAGDVRMWAKREGWISVDLELKKLEEGELRENVVVTLRAGNVLKGFVRDSKGQPAPGAAVRVTQRPKGLPPVVRDVVALDDGSFTCTGLGASHVDVLAKYETLLADPKTPGDANAEPRKRKMRVTRDDVEANTKDLVLTLVDGVSIQGRVHDDLGRTLLRYTAGAMRTGEKDPHAIPRTVDAKGRQGLFELDDLEPGSWDVFVIGRGIVYEPARRIEIPYTGEPLVFVVRRPAVVSGVVLDSARKPAVRMLVEIEWERPALFGETPVTERTSVTSAPDGKFEITEVFPGKVRVTAMNGEGRKSVPLVLELTSGAAQSGVELVLPP